MFYIYTVLIPILIAILVFYFERKLNSKLNVIKYLFEIFKILFTYSLLLYYLEMEHIIDTSWAFYSIMFFLVPFGIIITPLRIYSYFKNRKIF